MQRMSILLLATMLCSGSTLRGQSFWIPANVPEGLYSALSVDSLGFLYAVGDSGTYRSTNNGATWANEDAMSRRVYSYLVRPNGDRFAAVWDGAGLQRRLMQDSVWTTVLAGYILNVAADENGTLFAGSRDNGIYRSTDNGTTWDSVGVQQNKVRAFTVGIPGLVFAGHLNGIHKSTDSGTSWTQAAATTFDIGYISMADSGFMYAAAEDSGKILRSTDLGQSWVELDLNNRNVRTLVVNSRGDVITICTTCRVLLRSTDHGLTWIEWAESFSPVFYYQAKIVLSSTGHVVQAEYGGLFRSSVSSVAPWLTTQPASGITETGAALNGTVNPNGLPTSCAFEFGQTANYGTVTAFVNVGSGQSNIPVTAVIGGLVSGRTYHFRFIAATSLGDTLHGDDTSFTTVITIPPSPTQISPIHGAVVTGPDVRTIWQRTEPRSDRFWIELATDSLFVFRLVDSSLTDTSRLWSGLVNGQTYWWKVRGFNVAGWGAFSTSNKFSISLTDVENDGIMPAVYSLEQNYPNPFNPTTTIEFSIPTAGMVTLTVFDVLGRGISTLLNKTMEPGGHAVAFDASALSSGVYFCRIISNGYVKTIKMMLAK